MVLHWFLFAYVRERETPRERRERLGFLYTNLWLMCLFKTFKCLFCWFFLISDGTLELNGEALVLTSLIPRYKGWPVSTEIILLLHLYLTFVIFYRANLNWIQQSSCSLCFVDVIGLLCQPINLLYILNKHETQFSINPLAIVENPWNYVPMNLRKFDNQQKLAPTKFIDSTVF